MRKSPTPRPTEIPAKAETTFPVFSLNQPAECADYTNEKRLQAGDCLMRTVLKYMILIGALASAILIINDQRKKLAATANYPNLNKPKAHSVEELQFRRDKIIDNIGGMK
jgi:hypothetical protein